MKGFHTVLSLSLIGMSAGSLHAQPGLPSDIQTALNGFRALHGPTWEVVFDEETQRG